jgi:hypothetical protein
MNLNSTISQNRFQNYPRPRTPSVDQIATEGYYQNSPALQRQTTEKIRAALHKTAQQGDQELLREVFQSIVICDATILYRLQAQMRAVIDEADVKGIRPGEELTGYPMVLLLERIESTQRLILDTFHRYSTIQHSLSSSKKENNRTASPKSQQTLPLELPPILEAALSRSLEKESN